MNRLLREIGVGCRPQAPIAQGVEPVGRGQAGQIQRTVAGDDELGFSPILLLSPHTVILFLNHAACGANIDNFLSIFDAPSRASCSGHRP